MNSKNFVVPMLSTEANSCLTNKNLEDINVEIVSYKLSSLLIKPGLEFLEKLQSLKDYVGWNNKIVLDASDLSKNSKGEYVLLCAFSGTKYTYSTTQIINLINSLAPDILLLPKNITNDELNLWTKIAHQITFFLPHDFDSNQLFGVYYSCNSESDGLKRFLDDYKTRQKYVFCELNKDLINVLLAHNNLYVESNIPARDGFNGIVYTTKGEILVLDDALKSDFNLLDESCLCETCANKFTFAYLHHLFANTPLLCQRLLILHNIYRTKINAKS
jgi:queuine tRNA-ribosyltransferase